ncbi:unnamed protein product [Gemmata massiliana]|uniref:Uncharacterized protein n=1 Tax=Gemmata massiliana TaxID=1210884 RepID=A0A6P2CWZ3_9BACT|nr:hypothetical protein [Gemmata massiliana]VTR93658.1 unnamed protein product [Gemmata massiliana]VTR93664.1 unnamed protein product [Gemmata massiliana]
MRLVLGRLVTDGPVYPVGGATAPTSRARFGHRHRTRLVLVSTLHPDANLFDPPPAVQRARVPTG